MPIFIFINQLVINDGYVYWWRLGNYLVPTEYGDMSVKRYFQTDCVLMRDKTLSAIFYKQPMGNGESDVFNPSSSEWHYPIPNTVHYAVSKARLNSLTKVLARYGASNNILVNAIAPGLILTDQTKQEFESGDADPLINMTLLNLIHIHSF